MDLTMLSSLAVVGVLVSLLVQWLKQRFGGGSKTIAILVGLSVVAGFVGLLFKNHPNWLAISGTVLVSANAFYSFVVQWFEKT